MPYRRRNHLLATLMPVLGGFVGGWVAANLFLLSYTDPGDYCKCAGHQQQIDKTETWTSTTNNHVMRLSATTTTTTTAGNTTAAADATTPNKQQVLKFADLEIIRILGAGAFSVACEVKVPGWVYVQQGLPAEMVLVLKMAAEPKLSGREVQAWQRISSHPEARSAGFIPLVFAAANMTNPWDCGRGGRPMPDYFNYMPTDAETKAAQLLCRSDKMDIFVMPAAWQSRIFKKNRTIHEVSYFMRSLLKQMSIAHQTGVNNNDLSVTKNINYNEDNGAAVLVDWNGGMMLPERNDPVSWEDWSLDPNPPEYWAQLAFEPQMKTVVLHGVDVWQIGMAWARIWFSPCGWKRWNWDHDKTLEYIRENLQAIGDNETILPLNATFDVDILPHAYQTPNPPPIQSQVFTPLLALPDPTDELKQSECPAKSSWFFDNDSVPTIKKVQALDMLRQMLRIDPRQRPTCDELYRHPFFFKPGSTHLLETWLGVDAYLPTLDKFVA